MNKRYIPLLITVLFLVFLSGNVFGQRRQQVKSVTISSTIKDDSGTPIPDAVIYGKEGAIETRSDENGMFSIEVPENTDLLIEAKGFQSLVIPANLASQPVTMIKLLYLMDETSVVNVPFRQVRKGEIANAVTVLNPQDIIKYDNTQSIYDFITGRTTGMLGSNNIRGFGAPVFIIDGIPRVPTYLNMEEVEQITVLKDVNAAMLYGTQARNGLVMITTKRGQPLKRKFNFTVEQGLSKPVVLPEYLNTVDYMTLYNEALVNDGLGKVYSDELIANYASQYGENKKNPYRFPDRDYYSSEYLKSTRPFTKLFTEFSGGSNITQYYANLSWIHAGSLYNIGEGADASSNRFNIRANVNLQVSDNIKGFIDAVGIFDLNKGPRGSFWSTAATELPNAYANLLPVGLVKSDATFTGGADLEAARIYDGKYILGGSSQYQDNVYGNMLYSGYDRSMDRTATFNNGVDFDLKNITEGLRFKTYLSFDVFNTYHEQVTNTYAVYTPTWTSYPDGTDSITRLAQVNKDLNTGVQNLPVSLMYYERRFGAYALLDYNRTFSDDHTFTGTLLGYTDILRINNIISDDKHTHLGMRLGYDFQKKYFIDFTGALVNGFKLQEGNRAGFSPSIGLAWVISEDLMQGSSMVNYLKLKASAGIMNTEFSGTNYRLYEQTFQSGSSFAWYEGLRSNRAVMSLRAANPDLTFEKIKNINLGFEGYFFDNSLYAEGNLFTSKNTGQVVQRTAYYPDLLYLNIPYENYEETGYSGADLGLMWSESLGEFSFDLGTNLLYTKSKAILRDELWANDYQYRQGRPADAIFALEAIGFFKDTAEINNINTPRQLFGPVVPGDIKYKDQNGDKVIDSDDAIEIGNSTPRFTFGINLTMRYQDFTLFALGHGQTGSDAYYSGNYFRVDGGDKYSEVVLNRWTPATAETATYPRLSSKANTNNTTNSTFWLYANNMFNLDRIQLTYDLPRNISRKLFTKEVAVYLRGENLARFSKDAEKRQLVIGGEPSYRNYALGVKVKF